MDKTFIKNNESIIFALAKLKNVEILLDNDNEPESAIALVGEMKILIPLAGLIDKDQEIARLNKEIDKLNKLQLQFSGKLNNNQFISSAPEAVVEKEKLKLASVEQSLDELGIQLKKISQL